MERRHRSLARRQCLPGEPDGACLVRCPRGTANDGSRSSRQEAGLRLGLLSNSFGLDPFNPYEHAEIWKLFDTHVISEAVGLAKPDPAIYQLALDRLDLPGQACVFVDDREVNLPPAEALGIATVHAIEESATVAELERLLGVSAVLAM